MNHRFLPALFLGLVALTGCNDTQQTIEVEVGTTTAAAALPTSLALAAAPDGAVTVGAAKTDAKEGDKVVVQGRVGGTVKPIVEGRAVLTLAGTKAIIACDEMPGDDHCEAPWDYCCEAKEKIMANTLTVQVVGDDGKPLAADFGSIAGVEPGARIVVQGTVAKRPDPKVLIVNATGIFVTK